MTAVTELPDLYEVPETEEDRARFTVDGIGKAAWAIEKALDAAARQQEIRDAADAAIERYQAWAAEQIEKLQARREFFEGHLERYALAVREADPRQKSVPLPFGTVETRSTSPTWAVSDPDALMPWLRREHPELIKTERKLTEKLLLADARKALEVVADVGVMDPETREMVPGVELVPGGVKATVKLDGFA